MGRIESTYFRRGGPMFRIFRKIVILLDILVALPLLGLIFTGRHPMDYLHFPPHTEYVRQESFSPLAFFFATILFVFLLLPFLIRGFSFIRAHREREKKREKFPWWGWAALTCGVLFWLFAWTRFSFFSPLQKHTFTPLWLSYIFFVNALTFMRRGSCMWIEKRGYFLSLFPISALFWWFFEFLNRFVHNWYYTGTEDYGPLGYILFASISFSTVLPAVLSTRELLLTSPLFKEGFKGWKAIGVRWPRVTAGFCILLFGAGLFFLGVLPGLLYPLLWLSPLAVIISMQAMTRSKHPLSGISRGDWSVPVSYAAAALVCGFFWEMWNSYSLAKWSYSFPFFYGLKIFEMPLLGFMGYLPFGLECAAFTELFHHTPEGEA